MILMDEQSVILLIYVHIMRAQYARLSNDMVEHGAISGTSGTSRFRQGERGQLRTGSFR
jgi:hypothetical protein